jgi:hypothetical protein
VEGSLKQELVFCSKSAWIPSIRREHALAGAAAARGHDVTFIEQPRDIRWLRELGVRAWTSQLAGQQRPREEERIDIIERTTIVPPYRGRAAQVAESALLGRILRSFDRPEVAVVATTPWQWPAVSRLVAARRIFDCVDDWTMLVPKRRDAIVEMQERIVVEADALIVDSPWLARGLARRDIALVRNAVDERLLAPPLSERPNNRSMAYAGTLTERLDTDLLRFLIAALPDSRLDLYGECRFAGRRDQPSIELSRLLTEFTGRIVWHGPVGREELALRLDDARVLLIPHRAVGAVRGDSMKLYDYAARGRPIVSTSWVGDVDPAPPAMYFADAPEQFVDAVMRAMAEDAPGNAELRRAWAEENRWTLRWDAWAEAVFNT